MGLCIFLVIDQTQQPSQVIASRFMGEPES